MDNLQNLINELNNLPSGNISKKNIKGHIYYYYQYRKDGKSFSEYIRKDQLPELQAQITRRQEIEKEIKSFEQAGRNLKTPSRRSLDLTGDLMMGNTVVAQFNEGIPTYIDQDKSPLLIKRTGNIRAFLSSRAIDRERVHSRLLKKLLGIREDDDAIVSIYSYGASITDNYWFKAKGSKLKYEDISFEYDYYSDLVLKGTVGFVPKSPKLSPQLTLTGSYEKCWKLIDGYWYLFKDGSENEIFSELFSSKLASLLGVPTACYEYDDGYIKTKNIADVYNLEPISSIAGEDDSYENVFNAIIAISEEIAIQYLKLILFDFIIYNVDRHNENCALYRDKVTGKIISLAPNYDNNMSLIAATENLHYNSNYDGMKRLIEDFLKKSEQASLLIKKVEFHPISREEIQSILNSITIKKDEELICNYIIDRYNYIQTIIN